MQTVIIEIAVKAAAHAVQTFVEIMLRRGFGN